MRKLAVMIVECPALKKVTIIYRKSPTRILRFVRMPMLLLMMLLYRRVEVGEFVTKFAVRWDVRSYITYMLKLQDRLAHEIFHNPFL